MQTLLQCELNLKLKHFVTSSLTIVTYESIENSLPFMANFGASHLLPLIITTLKEPGF